MFNLSIALILFLAMIIVSGVRPVTSDLSLYELRRRARYGDDKAGEILDREELRDDILSLKRTVVAVIAVIITLVYSAMFGWYGSLLAVLAVVVSHPLSQVRYLTKISAKLYRWIEKPLVRSIKSNRVVSWLCKTPRTETNRHIGSRQELEHMLSRAENVLTADEKNLIMSGLSFDGKTVQDVMVPREKIISIDRNEFLGPLVLNDLHKVGHKRLPVIDEDIDTVVGIINIRSLLALDNKRSLTAGKLMESKVYYIRQDRTLPQALATFSSTHSNMLIVVDAERKTVGLLTMEDVMEALFGRRVTDRFDDHDNLRAVAAHKEASLR